MSYLKQILHCHCFMWSKQACKLHFGNSAGHGTLGFHLLWSHCWSAGASFLCHFIWWQILSQTSYVSGVDESRFSSLKKCLCVMQSGHALWGEHMLRHRLFILTDTSNVSMSLIKTNSAAFCIISARGIHTHTHTHKLAEAAWS